MTRTTATLLAFLAVTLTPALLAAQDKPDLSSPKSAAKAFADAVMAGDAAKAKAICAGDEKQMKIVEAMVGLIGGIKKLEDAMIAKFGKEAVKSAGKSPVATEDMHDAIRRLGEGEVKVTGDTATVTPKKKPGGEEEHNEPLTLKKVGGDWKVDLASLTKDVPGGEEQLEGMRAFARMIQDVTKDVSAGKFKTAAEANQGIAQAFIKMGQEQAAKEQQKGEKKKDEK